MPAPATFEYSVDTIEAAHQAVLDLIDAGASSGTVKIRDESDTQLAEIPLDDPAGTINVSTGRLTITASGPDTDADATGTCSYGEICDSDGNVILTLPAESGTSAVLGKIVLNSLSIAAGAEVTMVSAIIG